MDHTPTDAADGAAPARGVRVLTAETFSFADAVGGWRGLVESTAPGLVFVVVFIASGQQLTPPLVASVAVALVAVVARLVQRTPLTQALGGVLGVGIGVIWAWRSGEAGDYYVWGLLTNVAYLAGLLVSLLVRWPAAGLVVEGGRSLAGAAAAPTDGSDGSERTRDEAVRASADVAPAHAETERASSIETGSTDGTSTIGTTDVPAWKAWRSDAALVRRYVLVTWLWVAMFGLRLAVQGPLYLADMVGWLGTARLVMGVPLFALTLWASWVIVRRPSSAEGVSATA
ncbi:uncharacterized protein DUF3159 [Sediminihabitans luteus]|uniref:Uncharacterized protein DUF3159 n=1 Tax=Sediminihabitans luteus TaxID=1138585 RepID=A0A2M9CQ82_9CELL|nr:DUF3159 domain-containing protein [Sediminihabitans luteus]PJJ74090.1 uncharacterized protein DUF3159 [Sediminihabitans luteus]GII97995.1 hypothetical protein Slu03_03730 [Sediminihabitans luteus]